MNEQRRFIIKALGASCVIGFTYGGYNLILGSQSIGVGSWLKTIKANGAFKKTLKQYPDPLNVLLKHLDLMLDVSGEVIAARVSDKIKKDFLQNNILVIGKWYLSFTEAMVLLSAVKAFPLDHLSAGEKTFENAQEGDFLNVERWGPKGTFKGVKFNEQPNGHCGLWVLAKDAPSGLQVYIDGKRREIYPSPNGFTTGIYDGIDAFLSEVGPKEIVVYDEVSHRKQKIGEFLVDPPFKFHQYDNNSSKVFGVLKDWGPKKSKLGGIFNSQPNGNAAFWIKIHSASNHILVAFNNYEHKAQVHRSKITVSIAPNHLPSIAGEYPVHLIDEVTKENFLVGSMVINL